MDTAMGNMTVDRFWDLLSKKISSEATDAELSELDRMLFEHPDLRHAAETLSIFENQVIPFDENNEAEEAFEKHIEKIKKDDEEFEDLYPGYYSNAETHAETRPGIKRWWLPVMALAVVAIAFLILNTNLLSGGPLPAPTIQSQVSTKPGSKTQIKLPDGSVVWLNASSNMTYGENFGKELREVNLLGEAFFDVVKDPIHPFIIHTTTVDVKVLGTVFNVRSYPNDANTETSVLRGRVEVTVKNRDNTTYYLKPNEKVIVANNSNVSNLNAKKQQGIQQDIKPIVSIQPLTYYHVDSSIIETSWVENKLIFQENETFKEVALKMERWYGVRIRFEEEQVAGYRMYGSFTNETIRQALDALKIGFNFNYRVNKDEIVITK
jgi:transmembrane sensor